MKAERSVRVEFHLEKYAKSPVHPRDITPPENAIDIRWIPQIYKNAIWALIEFKTSEERDKFRSNLSEHLKKAVVTTPEQNFYDKWVYNIDTNKNPLDKASKSLVSNIFTSGHKE